MRMKTPNKKGMKISNEKIPDADIIMKNQNEIPVETESAFMRGDDRFILDRIN